jgi:hypothetical protein
MKRTKVLINTVLGLCLAALVFICVDSIVAPVHYQHERKMREAAVVRRMVQIRKAEEWYKQLHNGAYTANFTELVATVKSARIFYLRREAARTDTVWTPLLQMFGPHFVPDSLPYIPYSDGQKFALRSAYHFDSKSSTGTWLMECSAPYDAYLYDLKEKYVESLKREAAKVSQYPGLMFGDINTPNDNKGNWE